jgi:hypothetical protein
MRVLKCGVLSLSAIRSSNSALDIFPCKKSDRVLQYGSACEPRATPNAAFISVGAMVRSVRWSGAN